ncbi:MAG: hypothetical protein AB9834_13985 [Lentimicrobium sp.]
MKNSFLLYLVASLIASIVVAGFGSCESSAQRDTDAYVQEFNSRRGQESMRRDSSAIALKGVSTEEWEMFRIDSDKKLKDNEVRITDLKMKINRSGKKSDLTFAKWVYVLEQQNRFLKERIEVYPEIQSDWESFEFEINKDLEKLLKELKELDTRNGS